MSVQLSFLGGVREATGSNFLLETDSGNVLIDCGFFQGCHFCEGRNRQPFPFDPSSINAVIVSHAHVDHTGRLPKLVQDGFPGNIYATAPTHDFTKILLEDSARILEEEARARKEDVLYGQAEVASAMERFVSVGYREAFEPARGIKATFHDAGHILGSATTVVEAEGMTIVFSGDLGNAPTPLLADPDPPERASFVLIESVYGGRKHEERKKRRELLAQAVSDTVTKQGTLLIPVFAVERTQEILSELNALLEGGSIRNVPVFVDSPLAIHATEIYQKYPSYYNADAQHAIIAGDIPFRFPGLRYCMTKDQSKEINSVPPPKIILAGSGMFQGGRILHHVLRYLPDERSMLLMVGYQAAGSLGRRLLARPEVIEVLGERIPVRAQIQFIGGYSSHADQDALLRWLAAIKEQPEKTFVVQGEEASSLALRQEIRSQLHLDAIVPMLGDRVELR